jgi:RNA polymerase sigma-70 factor (ECF subfamily)
LRASELPAFFVSIVDLLRPAGALCVLHERGMKPSHAPEPSAAPAAPSLTLRRGLRDFVARRVPEAHVDDLVQDVLLRMHERAAELRDETRVAAWAHRIAASVVADFHRARRPEVELTENDEPVTENEDGNVNEIVAGWLRPMLALLPEEYADALEKVDVEGASQKAYAERVGLSASGAKSRVQRGRRMLEDLVRMCCHVELDAHGNVIGFQSRRDCRKSG